MKTCPKCKGEVNDKILICPFCGTLLQNHLEITRSLSDTDIDEVIARFGTAHFSRMNLILQVRGASKTYVFDAEAITELTLGRMDPDTGEAPEVDLQDCGAVEKGVSRRHAAVLKRDNNLHLIDRGSPNGTYLNGQRLIADQARVLRDGDEVRLGHLVLVVSFEKLSPLGIDRL
ncbi:MAG: FHA domain-containing protein [Anaerolineae bacterium]|nr:FHA domain-containing protein [Anaerolineae bacterium]